MYRINGKYEIFGYLLSITLGLFGSNISNNNSLFIFYAVLKILINSSNTKKKWMPTLHSFDICISG